MSLELVTAPAALVSTDDLKAHTRVDISDDDTLIDGMAAAAVETCEDLVGRAFMSQTWRLWLDAWPAKGVIRIPKPPLQSVTHVKYYDESNNVATLSSSNYFVDSVGFVGSVSLSASGAWPSTSLRPKNGIEIEFVAGYETAGDVPARYKAAVKLLTGSLYENRENTIVAQGVVVTTVPDGVERLLMAQKVYQF